MVGLPNRRVLILTSQTSDSGAWVRARGIALGLREAGYEVRAPLPPKTLPLFLHFVLPFPFYLLWALVRRYDWILVLKPYPHAMLPALAARILRGSRILCDVDDIDWEYRDGFLSTLLKAGQKPWPRRADRVSYHHPDLRARILGDFGVEERRLLVLPQGTFGNPEIEKLRDGERKREGERERPSTGSGSGSEGGKDREGETGRGGEGEKGGAGATWRRGEGAKTLGYLAHFNQGSEEAVILEVGRRVQAQLPGLRLLFIGGGPGLTALRAAVRPGETISFTGEVEPGSVFEILKTCDVLLHFTPNKPANRYRCSMKLRDYLASGRPVAANGLFEAALYKDVIYTTPGDDPGALADLVLRLLRGGTDGREKRAPGLVEGLDWRVLGRNLGMNLEAA